MFVKLYTWLEVRALTVSKLFCSFLILGARHVLQYSNQLEALSALVGKFSSSEPFWRCRRKCDIILRWILGKCYKKRNGWCCESYLAAGFVFGMLIMWFVLPEIWFAVIINRSRPHTTQYYVTKTSYLRLNVFVENHETDLIVFEES